MEVSEVFPCRALGEVDVELTAERRTHIQNTHSADSAIVLGLLRAVVEEPDLAFRSLDNDQEYLLSREFEFAAGSKHIVAIIVEQTAPRRFWIVTAFVTRRLSRGGRWIAI